MKMKAAQKVHYDSGPNMTPLVDIVMVILIFLMLTGTFTAGMHYLQSNIPVTKKGVSGAVTEKKPFEDEQLEIRVDSFTRPGADGLTKDMWSASAGQLRVEDNRQGLIALLEKLHKNLNSAGTTTEKIQVVINPGRATKYKHLVEVYGAALEAKFTKIAFSTAH
jgi:biopolymer transport protein ExbD